MYEADTFDCGTCLVAQHIADLWPENAEAWRLFHRLGSRFVADTRIAAFVLDRLTADWSDTEVEDVIERLSLLYDVMVPRPERTRA